MMHRGERYENDRCVPSVGVVIPTYNRRAYTEAVVAQLLRDPYPEKRIYLCDSGSTDGTLAIARQGVWFLSVGNDKWWSGAVNAGIRKCLEEGHDFVLLLNDDLALPPALLAPMVQAARESGEIVCAAQVCLSGKVFFGERLHGRSMKKIPVAESPSCAIQQIDVINGSCLLIPQRILVALGGVDEERCPHFGGDTEFILRARNQGYRLFVLQDVRVAHKEKSAYDKYDRRRILTDIASPYRLRMHLAIGKQLFNPWRRHIPGYIWYHGRYVLSVASAVVFAPQTKQQLVKILRGWR